MTIELKVPSAGESVSEAEISEWLKQEGDSVRQDESLVVLETDKATMDLPSPVAGKLTKIIKQKGDRVEVGEVIGYVEPSSVDLPSAQAVTAIRTVPPAEVSSPEPSLQVSPAGEQLAAEKTVPSAEVVPVGPSVGLPKEDVERGPARPVAPTPGPSPAPGDRAEEAVPMSLLRRKIAERLVHAQQTAALLTTFNEIDMSAVMALRQQYQDRFQERHHAKLGLMSFFVKATVEALGEVPQLNAEVRGTQIVYRNYFDIGIAVSGGRGLVVPVLRDAQRMSFAEIELAIASFAQRAKENQIRPEDLQGGTFSITNGGVFGSLLSTPIVNPPQSGVLGLHVIQDRPVAVGGQVVIRPMMYVALTYDHRIVDGREAVTFLRRVRELVEAPARMLMEV